MWFLRTRWCSVENCYWWVQDHRIVGVFSEAKLPSQSSIPYRQTFGEWLGLKLFPKSMILNESWNFVNSGNDPGELSETFSRYWKKVPEKPLSHDPFLGKHIFWWVSTHEVEMEIVSAKSPPSWPEIAKSGKSLETVSGISPVSTPVFWK